MAPADRQSAHRTVRRHGGFAPLRDYAVIGDGLVAALVARDGAIDWLCTPSFEGPSVFAAVLDPLRGGAFTLAPLAPFEVERRYVEATNVLETTFHTREGVVRVTDALNVGAMGRPRWRELVRRVDGVSGRVAMAWRVEPRFDWAAAEVRCEARGESVLVRGGRHLAAVQAWDAGEPVIREGGVEATATVEEGATALLCVALTEDEPLALPARDVVERRLATTQRSWREWVARIDHDLPVHEAVQRSALALGLLVDDRRGPIVGAATTSLPESLGGQSNFDYRLSWLRDGTFALDALLHLGFVEQAQAAFAFLLRAGRATHPRLGPIYNLDGRPNSEQSRLELQGYMDSQPVRIGNGAVKQHQFGSYGDALTTAALFVSKGHVLDEEAAVRLAELADHVCDIWATADAGFLGAEHPRALHVLQDGVLGRPDPCFGAGRGGSHPQPQHSAVARRGGGDRPLPGRELLVGGQAGLALPCRDRRARLRNPPRAAHRLPRLPGPRPQPYHGCGARRVGSRTADLPLQRHPGPGRVLRGLLVLAGRGAGQRGKGRALSHLSLITAATSVAAARRRAGRGTSTERTQ